MASVAKVREFLQKSVANFIGDRDDETLEIHGSDVEVEIADDSRIFLKFDGKEYEMSIVLLRREGTEADYLTPTPGRTTNPR